MVLPLRPEYSSSCLIKSEEYRFSTFHPSGEFTIPTHVFTFSIEPSWLTRNGSPTVALTTVPSEYDRNVFRSKTVDPQPVSMTAMAMTTGKRFCKPFTSPLSSTQKTLLDFAFLLSAFASHLGPSYPIRITSLSVISIPCAPSTARAQKLAKVALPSLVADSSYPSSW